MSSRLSIRSYTSQARGHFHKYHQLVLPLHGFIEITVGHYAGMVSIGECVVIKAGQRHEFQADANARFIVADMDNLPDNILAMTESKFVISQPLLAYVQFIEKQLVHQVDSPLESMTFDLFYLLIAQQSYSHNIDHRIERALGVIKQDISLTYSLEQLAKVACLSLTQYKKIFKQSMGMPTHKYITQLRMDRARTLLTHTDLPVRIVAEQVGYQDLSLFSRRFSRHFGQSPKLFTR